MSRPTEFFAEDDFAYWFVSLVDIDGTPIDADSLPTLAYRRGNGTATTTTGVFVTKVAATTGLYQFRHNTALDGLLTANTSIHYVETAIINGVTYTNFWSTIVRSVATLTGQAAQTVTLASIESDAADTLIDTAAIDAKTSQLNFTVANQVDANSLTGGGDATAANQTTIIAKLTTPAVVYTNPSSPNKLTIIRGDAYDDATENNGKLTWATGKTLTGSTVRFTIRDASDNILIDQTTAGVSTAVDSQTAEVSLTSAATALLTVATTNKFDAEAYWSGTNRWTFARGNCTVLEDQTRT